MNENIKNQALHGVFWSAIDNFARLGITFIFGIILARLLSPADFGVIALLTIFIAISNVFIDSGFSNALIRKVDLTEQDKSTAFFFNIGVGAISYVILFAIAPLIANFYKEPILVPLLRVTSITVLFSSIAIVQQSILTINIDFRKQAVISVVSAILSGLVGVYMAYNGYGVWSLAFQQIISSFSRMVLLCLFVRWKPLLEFSVDSFRYLFSFGSKILASGLLNTIWVYLYPIIIGKVFTTTTLGLYSRADQLSKLPATNMTTVLQRVTYPVLCKIQTDKDRLTSNYRRLLKISAFVIFPVMSMLSALAYPLVDVLLGEKWLGCVYYLKVLCFAMMFYPIHAINLNLLQVVGRSDLYLKLEIIKKILAAAILLITLPMGVAAMCYGLVVDSVLSLIINTYYTGKILNLGIATQIGDIMPSIANCILLWFVIYLSNFFVDNTVIQLILSILSGTLSYICVAYLFRFNEISEIKSMIKNL